MAPVRLLDRTRLYARLRRVSRSPAGRFQASPSLVVRSSLLSPGDAAPRRLARSYALDEQRPGPAAAGAGSCGMRVLVLGGTHHVGRAVVETALARGDDVTTLNRGVSGHPPPGALVLHADRTDPAALRAALSSLGDGTWDAVIDTWRGAPCVVADAAALLADR